MKHRLLPFLAVAVLLLTGCSAPGDAETGNTGSSAGPSAAPEASPSTADAEAGARTDPVTDADTCAVIGDVMTILFNAEAAARDGRMQAQEHNAWNRLAARVFDRAPISGEGALSQAVAEVQAAIPDSPPGALGTTLTATEAWDAAYPAISRLCAEAGAEIVTEGFVGG